MDEKYLFIFALFALVALVFGLGFVCGIGYEKHEAPIRVQEHIKDSLYIEYINQIDSINGTNRTRKIG